MGKDRRVGFKYCVVCGAEYSICPQCEELANRKILSWKYTCDTRECFQMFLALKAYADKDVSKEEARDSLKTLGVESLPSYNESVAPLIKEIMAEPKKDIKVETQLSKTKFVK